MKYYSIISAPYVCLPPRKDNCLNVIHCDQLKELIQKISQLIGG